MLSELEKSSLTQEMRDLERHGFLFALFAGIAFLALLLVISTSRTGVLSAPRLWVLDFFDDRMAWNPRWTLLLSIIGATVELASVVKGRKATRMLDLDHYENLSRSDPAAFKKLIEGLKKSN